MGGDLGCHLAARHPSILAALVLLDAGYSDPPLDRKLTYRQRVQENSRAWRSRSAPSWDAVVNALRRQHRRWTPAIEKAARAGYRTRAGQLVPAVSPSVVAAVEHGMAQAPRVDLVGVIRERCAVVSPSRAGMILPWIRRRGSGFGAASSRAFPAQCCQARIAGSGGCAPTATTRRYHE